MEAIDQLLKRGKITDDQHSILIGRIVLDKKYKELSQELDLTIDQLIYQWEKALATLKGGDGGLDSDGAPVPV